MGADIQIYIPIRSSSSHSSRSTILAGNEERRLKLPVSKWQDSRTCHDKTFLIICNYHKGLFPLLHGTEPIIGPESERFRTAHGSSAFLPKLKRPPPRSSLQDHRGCKGTAARRKHANHSRRISGGWVFAGLEDQIGRRKNGDDHPGTSNLSMFRPDFA